MTILAATPYLILHGKAAQAIEFYQHALGATLGTVMRFGDVDESCPAGQRDRIMHSVLQVGKGTLMLSDGGGEGGAVIDPKVEVALNFETAEETHRCFDALAVNGKVREPLMTAPWGALFGALQDRFGVCWMFNCDQKPG